MGELMMIPWVLGVIRASSASMLIWKASVSAGTTTSLAPLDSTKGRYSGKKGATAMISLSGDTAKALITEISAGAAPQVRNSSVGLISRPKRRLNVMSGLKRTKDKTKVA